MKNALEMNASRFTGIADAYDNARPRVPEYAVKIIEKYLGKSADTVVDIGCGPGISTIVWLNHCRHVIGVEPNEDMFRLCRVRQAAAEQTGNISFVNAYGHDTGLETALADVVICSQSFHWMEPVSTLAEINRILKPGGVFATIDYDRVPISSWPVEKAHTELLQKVREIEKTNKTVKEKLNRYDKNQHLQHIIDSGHFRFAREVVFADTQSFTADRLINLINSLSSVNSVLKADPNLITAEIENYNKLVKEIFDEKTFPIELDYRMHIGIK